MFIPTIINYYTSDTTSPLGTKYFPIPCDAHLTFKTSIKTIAVRNAHTHRNTNADKHARTQIRTYTRIYAYMFVRHSIIYRYTKIVYYIVTATVFVGTKKGWGDKSINVLLVFLLYRIIVGTHNHSWLICSDINRVNVLSCSSILPCEYSSVSIFLKYIDTWMFPQKCEISSIKYRLTIKKNLEYKNTKVDMVKILTLYTKI